MAIPFETGPKMSCNQGSSASTPREGRSGAPALESRGALAARTGNLISNSPQGTQSASLPKRVVDE
eukprot:3558599-Pyramimonas_sp.AAC.1